MWFVWRMLGADGPRSCRGSSLTRACSRQSRRRSGEGEHVISGFAADAHVVRRTHEHPCWRVSGRIAQAVNGCPLSSAEYRASQLYWPGTYPHRADTTATF